jgi:hypothetical protein
VDVRDVERLLFAKWLWPRGSDARLMPSASMATANLTVHLRMRDMLAGHDDDVPENDEP